MPQSVPSASPPVGGFFALDTPSGTPGRSVLNLWYADNDKSAVAFHNARSALHHTLQCTAPSRIWLPAYICTDVMQAVEGVDTSFYPVNAVLEPDVAWLDSHLKPGDAALAVDYFGRSPPAAFLALVRARCDVTWIEDRAQALWPSDTSWGDYVLYSPRKLVGVADGGIMIACHGLLDKPNYTPLDSMQFAEAATLRRDDPHATQNHLWYPKYVEYEQRMQVGTTQMSPQTKEILASLDSAVIMTQRRANYRLLQEALGSVAFYSDALPEEGWVPFGFPLRLEGRDKIASALHAAGIFAAIHWKDLPSPADNFPDAHALSRQLLTLPCDQRYGPADMQRVITAVKAAL